MGLGLGRQHAVPALEARDLPRRRRRPVHRPLAERHRRPRARSAASTRTSSTWSRRCWRRWASTPPDAIRGVTQSPIEGVSFAHTFGDAKAQTRHHTQYFEMFGHRSLYHDGWRAVCPVPGPSFAEAGMGFGELEITEEKLRELDAKGWELYHVDRGLRGDAEPGRRAPRQADRDDRPLVRRGRQVQRAADRQPRHRAARRREAAARAAPRIATSTIRARPSVSNKIAPRILNRPHSITATVEIKDGAEGRAGRAGGLVGRLLALRQGPQAALRVQLPGRAALPPRDRHHHRRRPARAALRVRADRRARSGPRQGHAGPRAALRRRRAGREDRPAGDHPAGHRHHRRAHLRPRRRLDGDHRLPGPVRLHRRARAGGGRRLRRR